MSKGPKQIVLGVTGSIAAYKSADLIRRLQEKSFDVKVIMTKEAEQFITPLTLASLSGHSVYGTLFDAQENPWQMNHIQLARQAAAIVIAPATANIIGKLASGIADDLLTCTVLAPRVPVLIAPAMNDEMLDNPVVQENFRKLKNFGFKFVRTVKGKLACGIFGDGHLAEIEDIIKEVVKLVH